MTLNQPSLKHFKKMTTTIGIIQHAVGDEPDFRFGYSIDDCARALIAALEYYEDYADESVLNLASVYLNYIDNAQQKNGLFHNFADFRGIFIDKIGSSDSLGRVIWALGYTIKACPDQDMKKRALDIYHKIPISLANFKFLRSEAFALLGFTYKGDFEIAEIVVKEIVRKLMENAQDDWFWFEEELTYANAIIPYALLLYAQRTKDKTVRDYGLATLDFLIKITTKSSMPMPVGQDGWYKRHKRKAIFDQQVIDVADMILACLLAFEITHKEKYLETAKLWFEWFYGNNTGRKVMVDVATGGVLDGLKKHGVNENQGAESVVCYLMAYLEMVKVAQAKSPKDLAATN